MTTKQRAYLKSLAMTMEPIFPDRKIQHDTGILPQLLQKHWKQEN